MKIIKDILRWIFSQRKDLAVQYSGIDRYTLDDLDRMLGYNAFDVCTSILVKDFDKEKCGSILERIYGEDVKVEYSLMDREQVLSLIKEHVVFKGYVKIGILLFDKEYAVIERKNAEKIVRLVGEEIEMAFNKNNAFVIATYTGLATKLNWVGVATGIREYKDGSSEEVAFNILLVNDGGNKKLLVYEPDKKRLSEDGKCDEYKVYCGGMVIWG